MMQPQPKAEPTHVRRCLECGNIEVRPATVRYVAEVKHDGTLYEFPVLALHVWQCGICHEMLFDDMTHDQIFQGLREHLGLLSPEEIRARIEKLGLNQKRFSEQIGIAPETVSRWMRGANIQSRAYDNLMRLFFKQEEVSRRDSAPAHVVMSADAVLPWRFNFVPASLDLPSGLRDLAVSGELALAT